MKINSRIFQEAEWLMDGCMTVIEAFNDANAEKYYMERGITFDKISPEEAHAANSMIHGILETLYRLGVVDPYDWSRIDEITENMTA